MIDGALCTVHWSAPGLGVKARRRYQMLNVERHLVNSARERMGLTIPNRDGTIPVKLAVTQLHMS